MKFGNEIEKSLHSQEHPTELLSELAFETVIELKFAPFISFQLC